MSASTLKPARTPAPKASRNVLGKQEPLATPTGAASGNGKTTKLRAGTVPSTGPTKVLDAKLAPAVKTAAVKAPAPAPKRTSVPSKPEKLDSVANRLPPSVPGKSGKSLKRLVKRKGVEAVKRGAEAIEQPITPSVQTTERKDRAKADRKAQQQALDKPAKQQSKLVRDSFTMPKVDFDLIAALKFRGLTLGRSVKKSELLRAGLQALAVCSDQALLATLDKLEAIKMGRPKQAATAG